MAFRVSYPPQPIDTVASLQNNRCNHLSARCWREKYERRSRTSGIHDDTSSNAGKWILLLLLSVLYIAGSLYFFFDLRSRVTALSSDQDASKPQIADLSKRIQSADAQNS